MKYIEELNSGDCFELKGKFYLLGTDFKKNGQRFCLNLADGFSSWINQDTIVNLTDLFTMDKDNNLIAIKERKKENVSN